MSQTPDPDESIAEPTEYLDEPPAPDDLPEA